MKCRHCNAELSLTLVDLGSAPPSNAYLTEQALHAPEKWFPLRVLVCQECWLVQTEDFALADELFDDDYAYFSAISQSWLEHSERYVKSMVERFNLNAASHVVEVAANDGYLLQYVKERGIPCTGVEPTRSTAMAAREKGIEVVEDFFGRNLAAALQEQDKQADLMVANNVLAHVPDINDFVGGFSLLLKPDGVVTFEFPHLLRLMAECQFDTIYHEHYSYLSLTAVTRIFASNGLSIFDVEELPTHGGSLRVFAQRSDAGSRAVNTEVHRVLEAEKQVGMLSAKYYAGFQQCVERIKYDFLEFLLQAKRDGKAVAAYGAAAKGNTLINYAGVRPDLLSFVVDRNPAKQEKFLPGSRISIVDENYLQDMQPNYVLVLPWNIISELQAQLEYISGWGGKLVAIMPSIKFIDLGSSG